MHTYYEIKIPVRQGRAPENEQVARQCARDGRAGDQLTEIRVGVRGILAHVSVQPVRSGAGLPAEQVKSLARPAVARGIPAVAGNEEGTVFREYRGYERRHRPRDIVAVDAEPEEFSARGDIRLRGRDGGGSIACRCGRGAGRRRGLLFFEEPLFYLRASLVMSSV